MQIVAVFDSFLFLMNIPRSGRLEVKKQTTQRWLSPLSHYLFKLEKSSVTKLVSEGIHRQITDSRRNKTSRIKQISKHFVERSYRADPLQLHEAFFFFFFQNKIPKLWLTFAKMSSSISDMLYPFGQKRRRFSSDPGLTVGHDSVLPECHFYTWEGKHAKSITCLFRDFIASHAWSNVARL